MNGQVESGICSVGVLEGCAKTVSSQSIMAMVKANAYGHGVLHVARAFSESDGLVVARLQEALLLREAGITQCILLLGTLLDETDLAVCSKQNIDVTAYDAGSLADICAQARGSPLRVWLELDSGMRRLGLDPATVVEGDRTLSAHPGVLELIHMSHFSSAGDSASRMTEQQIARFSTCHQANINAPISLANSAALISRPDTRAEWVRPGIMLYGDNPLGGDDDLPLSAAMRLCAKVIATRQMGAGEAGGYDLLDEQAAKSNRNTRHWLW